jgi:DNA-binding beta-propeller fold protein YncE
MAFDARHGRIFSVCDGGHMAVLDAATGRQIATPSIGQGPDAAAFSEKHQFAFSSNGSDGTLTVIDAAHAYSVLESLPTQKGARTMTYDDRTDSLYLVTAEFGPRPEPTAAMPHPRPAIVPGSFTVLVVGR